MTTNNPMVFDYTYDIRSYEPQPGGSVCITAICDQMQDIASRHADTLGFGYGDLQATGHFWVLARVFLTMDRLPGFGESCRLRTWPSGIERLVATRDFLIHDAKGVIGRATSNWVALDLETHHASKPEAVFGDRVFPDVERAAALPGKAVPRLKEGEHATTLTSRRADQDINNHVNSVRYAEFCMESVPQSWLDSHACLALDLQFRNESQAGDTYAAACSEAGPDNGRETLLHSLKRTSDDKEIVRMRSWWEAL
ncbi:acyl-ACP thioesterase [Pseudodesulfovibrio cashew]|uniref:Acyl-ACP thioesterase n=1 Tax=Pseudodesulfovibrio cashew TaxID=2678688 RepID=A0A6I6JDU6_9BACT|nr:acyl-ACP thioesterase domain-containing protein [Pseudodesulfovibrio cashew]QGY38602.1 acyl-ACP thioesterase [Pseudodesulfovibrio cashew]